jgi:L-amino acid N-acyltransferase YncA
LGQQVVRALIAEALKIKKPVQYNSMQKNTASVALAESLGFHRSATETYWGFNIKSR